MKTLINLIGQQPIPNLLPIRHLKPEKVILIASEFTRKSAERMAKLIDAEVVIQKVNDPHNLIELESFLAKMFDELGEQCEINITGGTKPMSLATWRQAEIRRFPIHYFVSHKKQSLLQSYAFIPTQHGVQLTETGRETITEELSIRDYLLSFLPGYETGSFHKNKDGSLSAGGIFERKIYNILTESGFDVMANIKPEIAGKQVEIDMIIRKGNQFALAEIKRSLNGVDGPKKGIDQLNTATRMFGTYTKRALIAGDELVNMGRRIRPLAEANKIKLFELNLSQDRDFSDEKRAQFIADMHQFIDPR